MTTTRTRSRTASTNNEEKILRHVLLIEDQRSLAMVAAKMLHDRWGCQVLIATTLDQVRQIIDQKQHEFFVAVSDLSLPDAPEGQVIDVLVAAKIPVIAVTGAFDRTSIDKFMRKGILDYALKHSINAYDYVADLIGRLHRNTRIKVLVVDDSKSSRTVLVHMFQKQMLQVLTANDGNEALQLLEQHGDIKLVLVDYEMPGMDGFKFVANLRRKTGKDQVAVIGISGNGDKSVSSQFLKFGANDFIAKPFSYEELVCRTSHNLQMLENIESVRYVAYHDYLTGLFNRRAFFEHASKLFDKAINSASPLSAVMMDIDFFKKINDTQGHDGGDAVLRHFAALLEEHFPNDLVGRLGGEEFAILIAQGDDVIERCDAFRRHIENNPTLFDTELIGHTVSIGVNHALQETLDETIKLADANLYKAKSGGRNQVVAT
ncbi:MAG: diguanylate cyclase [Hylemonella sp.]|nr:diguanylate cyclase [Hylemonella sp.]